MIVRLAVIADAANVAVGQKLNILGAFSTIVAKEYPAKHPSMVLVLRLEFDYHDGGSTHQLGVQAHDPDGRIPMDIQKPLAVDPVAPGRFTYTDEVLLIVGLVAKKPGSISFVILWDGAEVARVPLAFMLASEFPQ